MGERLGYRPELDGLRGVAIVLVLLHHGAVFLAPSTSGWLAPAGFLGVDLFLVLSGFLITSLLLERWPAETGLGPFYRRRALRLLPAVAALMVVSTALEVLTGNTGRGLSSLVLVGTYTTNLPLGLPLSPWLGHMWSLALEEQFYLLWPAVLLLVLLRRGVPPKATRWALTGTICLVVLWRSRLWLSADEWYQVYSRTDARLDALLVGVLVALRGDRRLALGARAATAVTIAASAALVVAVFTLNRSADFLYFGGFTLVALLCAVLVVAALDERLSFGAALAWSPLVRLGVLSYSLYLWHFPAFWIASYIADPTVRVAVALSSAGLFSVQSYRLIETPFLQIKARQDTKPVGSGRPATGVPPS